MSSTTPLDTSASTLTAFPPPSPPPPLPTTTSTSISSSTTISPDSSTTRPTVSADAVLKPSDPIPPPGNNMSCIGFQGSSLSRAASIINKMRSYRSSSGEKATIFLGYTSNLISSGLRETLRFLVEHNHVSAVVTTAGGVEEDFIKCLAPTYLGAFHLDGAELRKKGLNRIGNLLVPNSNYCAFEDWIIPIFDTMLLEQEEQGVHWTPSSIIHRLGKEINDERSVYYWAYKNNIPVFCPALTDGSIGDMLYFHTYKSSPAQLRCDIVADIRKINSMAVHAPKSGVVVLGGGVVKHHIANANLMRNGAEWAVFVNTGSEYDGSDAGARPDEAVSWGKIKADGESVKVYCEATIAFPMLVAATWGSTGAGMEGERKGISD
ncbi:deoxyhypusine synthase-like protein [Trichophaea hybrida]|nr:deoxyhypusine synthase-like protein [Trichophaea hybrida]